MEKTKRSCGRVNDCTPAASRPSRGGRGTAVFGGCGVGSDWCSTMSTWRSCTLGLLFLLVIDPSDVVSQVHVDIDDPNSRLPTAEPAGNGAVGARSSFLELAKDRFEARNGRPATVEEETWTFDELQLIRVPKAGSSAASMIARKLGGCTPRGPCCRYPGDPPGSCPATGLMCPSVTGCTGHEMNGKTIAKLNTPSVFTMTNLRAVTDRMVSGFFYTSPHSPECAWSDDVDYEACFTEMTHNSAFQNVAARMVSGHYAYDGRKKMCLDKQQGSGDGSGDCAEDLRSVIQGACNINFVAMCETSESSVLLLFETLPWLGPSSDFFRLPAREHDTAAPGEQVDPDDGSRHNTGAKHEEGMKHITPELRKAASLANQVDEALHEFVSAKFCDRLREASLLDHPLVAGELATNELLDERCNNASWVSDTLERYAPLEPASCRIYRPFAKP